MSKLYLPQELINNSWEYEINANDYIVIHTYNNCYNNYNTQYCDCIKVYPSYDYVKTNTFSCYRNSSYATINVNDISSDFIYKLNISDSFIIFFILLLTIVYIPLKVLSRLFGRWLKW